MKNDFIEMKVIEPDVVSKETLTENEGTIKVLNNGYVRLVDYMGSDISVVNAARASFAKENRAKADQSFYLPSQLIDN